MGIFFKFDIFRCKSEFNQKDLIEEEDENFDHYEFNKLNDVSIKNERLKDERLKDKRLKDEKRKNIILCLKIYILGTGDRKEYVINTLFKNEITDDYLKKKANKEFKTDQFHWIARIYNDELTEQKCEEIREEIQDDKSSNENKLLNYQVILNFGNQNTEILSKHFIDFRYSRMIFITDSECELDEEMDKRYATNIICKNISNEQLNSKIISSLWELDCCFNEKGNQICRYTPEKIFNGLEKDNSLFSINILLTGLSRTGKSTFINLLAGKIIALEGDASTSVTKNISEYYIYKDDDKDAHGAIKIIDTPGIVEKEKDKNDEYKDVHNKVINMIKEQDKSFEKQIHFIFFVLNKGISLEGENILDVLRVLNESKCPVYFIINKVREKAKIKKVIDPIREFLGKNKCDNLINVENFITVNFKDDEDEGGNIHGIDKIFKKMSEHIKTKNYLNNELSTKMTSLLKDFHSEVGVNKLSQFSIEEDKLFIDKIKLNINFDKRMKEITELTSKNVLFSKIKLESLIENGKKIAKKCKKVIISLSNLKDILPSLYGDLPILSIFQAFMVKEIGEGFGLDINVLNYGTKQLISKMKNILSSMNKQQIEIVYSNNELTEILDSNELKKSLDAISDKVQNKLEKGNKDSILSLANLLNEMREINIKNEIKTKELELINRNFTNDVYRICLSYFEKELNESEGLIFMINYFNKCESLLKDIDYYTNKEDWGQYNVEIKY